jgi:hypothetical protein
METFQCHSPLFVLFSVTFGTPFDYKSSLGKKQYDKNETLVGAESIRMQWLIQVNTANVTTVDDFDASVGTKNYQGILRTRLMIDLP